MKNLAQRQKEFFTQVVDCCKATPDLVGARQLSPANALRIYQEAYPARLHEALAEKYKGVWTVLGDEKFHNLCAEYIRHNKSQTYNLENYGKEWPEFLQQKKDIFPFLTELATFEKIFHQIFHCQTEEVLKQNRYDHVTESSSFQFVSYLQLPVFHYNIYGIWQATKKGVQPSQIMEKTEYVLFSKERDRVLVKVIDPLLFHLLKCFCAGKNLLEALEEVNRQVGVVISPQKVQDCFKVLSQSQVIVAIKNI